MITKPQAKNQIAVIAGKLQNLYGVTHFENLPLSTYTPKFKKRILHQLPSLSQHPSVIYGCLRLWQKISL